MIFSLIVDDADDRRVISPNVSASTHNDRSPDDSGNAIDLGHASFYYGRIILSDYLGQKQRH